MNSRSQNLLHKISILAALLCWLSLAQANSPSLEAALSTQLTEQWQSISQHPDEDVVIQVSGLPAGYQAPNCDSGFQFTLQQDLAPGRNPVQVHCANKPAWQLNLIANLEVWRHVVINQQALRNKTLIRASQLSLKKSNIAQLHRGYFTDLQQVAGSISKRSLKPGTTITPTMIELPILIERGQPVTLRVSNPAVTVEMAGEALRKGRAGEHIRVRNLSSGKILFGKVISSELVLIQ